jgi:hypothetical protein
MAFFFLHSGYTSSSKDSNPDPCCPGFLLFSERVFEEGQDRGGEKHAKEKVLEAENYLTDKRIEKGKTLGGRTFRD